MSRSPCPRLFEVEAARDGRLTGTELASFERHMTGCPACLREARALEGLADALRTGPPNPRAEDMLHVRRERTRLLAAFDRTQVGPEPSPGAPRLLGWTTAVALVAGILVLYWRIRPAEPILVHASAVVHADSTAEWSERTDANREMLVLDRGSLWIHVDHASGEGRLVVLLPDGELEDTGTTFTVSAAEGHTTRVAVHEGRVVLRLHGLPPVAIGKGDTWVPEARPVASASASAVPPVAAADRSRDHAGPPPSARQSFALPASAAPTRAPEPSADFRAAMAALDAREDTTAAAAFARFLERHPRDPHAEDAAYLRVIALQRSGDGGGTKEAAKDYLRRYPEGFRRAEMEALAQ
jgi:hypothetical protein